MLQNSDDFLDEEWSEDDETLTNIVYDYDYNSDIIKFENDMEKVVEPSQELLVINQSFLKRISWNNFKKYLNNNWDVIEKSLTKKMAIQRKYYWNSFVRFYTSKILEKYYFTGYNNLIHDYKYYIKLRQKLHSFRYRLSIYQNQLDNVYYNIYDLGTKHKETEFDMINIFKRNLMFNSIEYGPKFDRVLGNFEYDWNVSFPEDDVLIWNYSFKKLKNWVLKNRFKKLNLKSGLKKK